VRLRRLSEAECYARCYGRRGGERIVVVRSGPEAEKDRGEKLRAYFDALPEPTRRETEAA
jgi:hypothetical protein